MQNQIKLVEYTQIDPIKEDSSMQQNTPLRRTFTSASVSTAKYISEQFSPATSQMIKLGGSFGGNGGGLQRNGSYFCEGSTQLGSNRVIASPTQSSIKKIQRQSSILEKQSKVLGRQSSFLDRSNPLLNRQETYSQERNIQGVSNGGNLSSSQRRINKINSQHVNVSQDRSQFIIPQDQSSEIVSMNSANKPKFFFMDNNKQDVSQSTRKFIQRQNTIVQHKRAQTQNKEIKLSKISSPNSQPLQQIDLPQTFRPLDLNSEYNSPSPSLSNKSKSKQVQQQSNQLYQEYHIDVKLQDQQDRFRKFDSKQIISQYNSYYGAGGQSYDKQRWSKSQQLQNNSQQVQTQQNKDAPHKNNAFNLKDIHYQKDTFPSKMNSYFKDSTHFNDTAYQNSINFKNEIQNQKDNTYIRENSQNKNIINTTVSKQSKNSIHSPSIDNEKKQFISGNNSQRKYLQSPLGHESAKSQELTLIEQYKLSIAKKKKKIGFQQSQHTSPTLVNQGNERIFSQSFCNNMLPASEYDMQINSPLYQQKTDRNQRVGKGQRQNYDKNEINNNHFFQIDENKFREIVNQKLNKVYAKINSPTLLSLQNSQIDNEQGDSLSNKQASFQQKQSINHSQFKQIDNQQLPYIPLNLIEEVENTQEINKNQQYKIKVKSNNSSPKKTVQIQTERLNIQEKSISNQSNSQRGSQIISSFHINSNQNKQNELFDFQKKNLSTSSVEKNLLDQSKAIGQQQFFSNKKNRLSEQLQPQSILKLQSNISSISQNIQLSKKSFSTNTYQNEMNSYQLQPQQQKNNDLQITITPQQIKQIIETEKKKKRIEQQNVIYNLVKQVEENSLDKLNQKVNNPSAVDKEINKKGKSRNPLINDILKQKNKQSIAVIQDILRMNNVTEIPDVVNTPDEKRKMLQFNEQSKSNASDHLTNKCKNQLGFSQTLYDLKITNSQFMNSLNNMVEPPFQSPAQRMLSNNNVRNSFRQMQYEDMINEYQNSTNYCLSPKNKNPQQIEKFNENKLFQQIIKDQSNQKKNGFLLRKALREALYYLHKLQISPWELTQGVVFSTKPFQKKHSRELIIATKKGDIQSVKDLILEVKYLVYDFDFVYLTALHWACKRNHIQIAQLLIQYGADVDAKDLIGRTPLYFAVINNNVPMANLLLMNQANPWSSPEFNINDLAKDNPELLSLLSKFRKLDIVAKMCKPHERQDFWKRQSYFIDQKGPK